VLHDYDAFTPERFRPRAAVNRLVREWIRAFQRSNQVAASAHIRNRTTNNNVSDMFQCRCLGHFGNI
jgi:hypothetical protein